MHRIAGLQVELGEVEDEHARPVGKARTAKLLGGSGLYGAAGEHTPDLDRHVFKGMVVARQQLDFDLVLRLDERIHRRRKDFSNRRRVRHDLNGERRRNVRDLRRLAASRPLPARGFGWLEAATEPASVRLQPHRVAPVRERDHGERFRGMARDFDRGARRKPQRRVTRQCFRRALEVRRIGREHRHIAEERAIHDTDHGRVAHGAAITRHERHVGIEWTKFGRHDASGERQRHFDPRVARAATPQHHGRTAASLHRQLQRRAAQQALGHISEFDLGKQRTVPRVHRVRQRAPAIGRACRDERTDEHGRHDDGGRTHRAAREALLERRGERGRNRCKCFGEPFSGALHEYGFVFRELDDATHRSVAKFLLALHGTGNRHRRRFVANRMRTTAQHPGGECNGRAPDEEWHRPGQHDPSRPAQCQCAQRKHGQHGGNCARRHRGAQQS